ncbi:g3658 [Coccomyxa viridis]|uniref:G3658 protein n=1 Tax=Coccomyxa viridis TaxID=1274662 RepID=A0ABP1FRP7_9CHLO
MKLTAIALLKWNGDKEPVLFGIGADLSSFGFFQRGSVKEMLTFVARTVAKRTLIGQRQTVQNEEYYCHAYNRDGLVGIAFADKEYPARAAFGIVIKVLDEFSDQSRESWRTATADTTDAVPLLDAAVQKYQDPAQADKLTKIQRDLDETKVILHKTIESMLERGEKLDSLVDKSSDLSMASQMFYKQARKTNSCCKMM